ncbi:hypothetical protein [Alloalcanivorax xenomutans]|jgi:hypothetical protein|uniref:O-antigen ligase n=1 Tax=Alloalcanivorax xenomutans TaxID=1094342 RepID=A0A9Q3W2J3_9GAMM|nr:hypothetical protein [Alloalcanivorax xenomutans]ERS10178.1 membrane protein [Alcanivorax sp. PN-3]KYZ84489.1 hypothetical protein A3Q32_09200 [Alcanivorax sp. KX64203]MBA4720021.1 hypothetical protein [Alcanivorax sp.]ARB44523.1 hypothetical protein P40_03050 [Alloalcanivorax xenomutans]MCE7509435.1 hypothetical protein [Alloalcanivorax xenomutans]
MTALRPNVLEGRGLRLWLTVSFAVMFTGPFLFHSRVALLNVVDVLFFLPSLTLLTRAVVSGDRRLLLSPWLVPLYALLGWLLLTMAWADNANTSRTVRGVVEIITLVGILRWLHLYYRHTLKQALTNAALTSTVLLVVIMISYYTTQPLGSPLFGESVRLIFDLPQPGPLLTTMALVTPCFILLAQAVEEGINAKGGRRAAGALVGFGFLVLVQWHTGIMLLVAALSWVLLRAEQRILGMLAAAVALYLSLDFEVLGNMGQYFTHPFFGNGLSQETGESLLVGVDEALRIIPHPDNVLLAVIHSAGLVGLILFIAAWAVPAWRLPDGEQNLREGAIFLIAVVPGLLAMLSVGAYLLVPFHPSWMSLWMPLALMLASLSTRDTIRPPVRHPQPQPQ